nr:SGNH hydrolase-type esterase domain-containing protein [Tanacetum cinerariifolium]
MSRIDDDLFTYEVENSRITNIPCDFIKEDDSEQQMSHETDDDMEYDPSDVEFTEWLASKKFNYKKMDHYTMKSLWIYWVRGDAEVELTDEGSSNSNGGDEVAEILRIETNVFHFERPLKDELYVAVNEVEYEDLTSTRKDACRAYQEIFRMMDEGWMVTGIALRDKNKSKTKETEHRNENSSNAIALEELDNSLSMGDEHLDTISEMESDEVIKSSVKDLFPITTMTFSNPIFNSNDDFTSSDDESLFDEDVPEENVKIYSNPLLEFDDEYISSDVNPLFDEGLKNIESKDSYDSNLDESTFLVTPFLRF